MKQSLKRVLAAAMTAVLTLTALTGCSSGAAGETSTGQGETSSGETAMGRYLEEEISLPEGISTILDIGNLTDGTLRVIGQSESFEGDASVWDSKDAGDTWEKVFDIAPEEGQYLSSAELSPTGESAYTIMTEHSEDSFSYSYKVADAGGNIRELEIVLPGDDSDVDTTTQNQTNQDQSEDESAVLTEEKQSTAESEQEAAESGATSEAANVSSESGSEAVYGVEQDGELVLNTYSSYISRMRFNQEGELYAYGGSGSGIYHIDKETGDILNTFTVDQHVSDFTIIEKQLVVIAERGVERYDLETGESKTKDENLNEQLSAFASEYNMYGSYPLLMQQGTAQDTIYFCNSSGLYCHVMEGSLSEQIIDGNLTTLGNPSVSLVGMALLADETYVVGISDDTNHKILRYTYSADTPTKPSQEITVYSLTDQLEVRQAISSYMKENPDILVNLEIGMTGDDAVTVSDALKTLNTNIAAGKGPDILVLDGMPVSTYIEKGLLTDLSELTAEIANSDGLYENITNTYKTEDGLYAIPARFAIPAIQGDADTLNQINDISSLADQAEKMREEDPDMKYIMDTSNQESFLKVLYSFYATSLMVDGKMDRDKVKEFYEQAKRIYHTHDESEEDYDISLGELPAFGDGSMLLLMGVEKIEAGAIVSMDGFSLALSVAKEMDNISYKLVSTDEGNVFLPKVVLGINSKTQKMNEAKNFVTYLLSSEAQEINQGSGLPVNRAGMEALLEREKEIVENMMYGISNEDGTTITLDGSWPTDEEVASLFQGIEDLNTMALDDDVVLEIFLEQGGQCLDGTISAEEAAANLIQKVNLYLAE